MQNTEFIHISKSLTGKIINAVGSLKTFEATRDYSRG